MKKSQTVLKLQSQYNFVKNRQTDRDGKNNMSPHTKGGDIMTIESNNKHTIWI